MNPNNPTRQVVPVTAAAARPGQPFEKMAFFGSNGLPLTGVGVPDTGVTVKLTGYAPHAAGAVSATDTVNDAIAKLEARVVALETAP